MHNPQLEDLIAECLFFHILLSFRIVRAFLVEEQKIVKKVLKLQKSKDKIAPKVSA